MAFAGTCDYVSNHTSDLVIFCMKIGIKSEHSICTMCSFIHTDKSKQEEVSHKRLFVFFLSGCNYLFILSQTIKLGIYATELIYGLNFCSPKRLQ